MKNRIKELRDARDLRQVDVAKATGIDQRTLSNYENGRTNPDGYNLLKLADFFDVSVDYIVCRPPKEYREAAEELNAMIDEIEAKLASLRAAVDPTLPPPTPRKK